MALTHEQRLAKAVELNKLLAASKVAGQLATIEMIRNDTITAEEMAELVDIYPSYEVGVAYKIGDIFKYEGVLYKVLQAHTSQADWIPSSTPALYLSKAPAGVIPEFVQPTGAQDAYNIGDKVLFNGQVWQSTIDANVWSPTGYPAGWQLIE